MASSRLAANCSTSGRHVAWRASRPGCLPQQRATSFPIFSRPSQPAGSPHERTPVCLSAATVSTNSSRLGLSHYQWPGWRADVHTWLEACIKDVARHLDQAPFLELMHHNPQLHFNRIGVPEALAKAPRLWRAVAEHVTSTHPEVVMLVSKIEPPTAYGHNCLVERQSNARQVLTGIATGKHQGFDPSWLSCEQMCSSRGALEVCSGSFGDCCEEEEAAALASAHHTHEHPAQQQASNIVPYQPQQKGAYQGRTVEGQIVDFWGVVVQSQRRSSVEGCYVLKTTRAEDPNADCQCTHYSLTRVCDSEPLADQLTSAWLP